eukprot:scaffold211163_cov30-Tisochrysis_lutea.AAC.1
MSYYGERAFLAPRAGASTRAFLLEPLRRVSHVAPSYPTPTTGGSAFSIRRVQKSSCSRQSCHTRERSDASLSDESHTRSSHHEWHLEG